MTLAQHLQRAYSELRSASYLEAEDAVLEGIEVMLADLTDLIAMTGED